MQAMHLAASNVKISVLDYLLTRVSVQRKFLVVVLLNALFMDLCFSNQFSYLQGVEVNPVDRMGGTPAEVSKSQFQIENI